MVDPALLMIDALRGTDPYIQTLYTQGGCYKFHLFLRKLWPNSLPVKNRHFSHVGTLINGKCYDINGLANWDWHAMSCEEISEAEKWSFTAHQLLLIGECPVCGEPICA